LALDAAAWWDEDAAVPPPSKLSLDAHGQVVLDGADVARAIRRMAGEILERVPAGFALVGIRRGGVGVTQRLRQALHDAEQIEPEVGAVDIALYRDDAATALPDPKIGPSHIPFSLAGRDVVLVDDVLQTGRTIRAAVDALFDYGRPRRVWLAVLCDRGGRELPLAADFVGRSIDVPVGARLDVRVAEAPGDGEDEVRLFRPEATA